MKTIKIIFSYRWIDYQAEWCYMVPSEGNNWIVVNDINQFLRDNELTSEFNYREKYQEIESMSIEWWQTRYALDCMVMESN